MTESAVSDEDLAKMIPATMGTQHPDNISLVPFGDNFTSPHSTSVVHFHMEPAEVNYGFSALGIEEAMIDFEGKKGDLIPFTSIVDLNIGFYKENLIGEGFHVTPRIPNPDKSRDDPMFYQSVEIFVQALLGQMSRFGVDDRQPFQEFIMPNATRGRSIAKLEYDILKEYAHFKDRYKRWADKSEFAFKGDFFVKGIPLIEDIDSLSRADHIWDELICRRRELTCKETYVQRSFIARSDPALKAGMVPGILAASMALSKGLEYEKRTGIRIPQIIGAGSAPFRGGLTPFTIDKFLETYKGISTVTLQSAFRYDWPVAVVKRAVSELNHKIRENWLERNSYEILNNDEIEELRRINGVFKKSYEASIEDVGNIMQDMAKLIPEQRDRYKYYGIGGYGREIAGKPAPRAIPFCAVFYNLGIPPGILGLRAYADLSETQKKLIKKTAPNIPYWICQDLTWLNKDNLRTISSKTILKDMEIASSLAPDYIPNEMHREITSEIMYFYNKGNYTDNPTFSHSIDEAAEVRRFLG